NRKGAVRNEGQPHPNGALPTPVKESPEEKPQPVNAEGQSTDKPKRRKKRRRGPKDESQLTGTRASQSGERTAPTPVGEGN
ncbi:MAG: ATP-dependent helicase, partial [Cytophagaceae bacterium]